MSNPEITQKIEALVVGQEKFLENNFPVISSAYVSFRSDWFEEFFQSKEDLARLKVRLTPLDFDVIYWRQRLILSSVFITAFYNLSEKKQGDRYLLSKQTILVLCDLLPNHKLNYKDFMEHERKAVIFLKKTGVVDKRSLSLTEKVILVAVVVGVLYLILK
jgi:hypothetical protein